LPRGDGGALPSLPKGSKPPTDEQQRPFPGPEQAPTKVGKDSGDFYRSLLAAFTPAEVRAQLRAAGLEELAVEVISDRHLFVSGRLKG